MIAICLTTGCDKEYQIDESLDSYERLFCTKCNIMANREAMSNYEDDSFCNKAGKRKGAKSKKYLKKRAERKKSRIQEDDVCDSWIPQHFD